MIELKEVTLCCISSVDIDIDNHIKALKYSSRGIQYGKTIFISDIEIREEGIQWIPFTKMNYGDWNVFVLNRLHAFINTEFILLIQSDGFVINPDKWDKNFLNYDYIGAPWPHQHDNINVVGDVRVGNGGFSLRSKKFLESASKINSPDRHRELEKWNEDWYYCVQNRKLFEDSGMKFAPLDTAKYFAHELPCEEIEGIIPFGFHGRHLSKYTDLIK
jgi:hypothetical protein